MSEELLENLSDPYAIPEGHKSGFVAVIGRPNVGKSTLMNRLVGEKVAIVSPKPQTTRSRILGILTHETFQVIFVDTPGIHKPFHTLGKIMVSTATSVIPESDVVLFLVDVSVRPTKEDRMIATILSKQHGAPIILVLNKMDLLPPDRVQPHSEAYWDLASFHDEWIMTIATDGTNVGDLLERIIELLPEGPRYYPREYVTDQTERQIVAELIREQVLRHTYHEVPHSVAVVVEEFKEREDGVTYIAANVFVERKSQKGIVIGRGGSMIRTIGSDARAAVERMIGGKVFLDLWVKVRERWREDERELRRLGFERS
ncbi:MAG: GTPase Era [Anaerolineae bacterium]|jgi:GTP-binding protein Era